MTDKEKLEAIRAEILRLVDVCGYDREMANDLLTFMDSLPNEPVSEELEEAAKLHVIETRDEDVVWDENARCAMLDFKAGAEWQKAKDREIIETAIHHAYHNGRLEMKEQMTTKAIDVEVKVDAGGYPYIEATELYDYDNDKPLAKAGDKIKVVFIKDKD